jgi:hypothetical protein
VAVADDGAGGVFETAGAPLAEAEAHLDVLGAGHAGVEGAADLVEDVGAVGGVGGDRVGRIGADGVALPGAEHAGRLALGGGGRGGVEELAGDAADFGVGEGGGEGAEPGGVGDAVTVDEGEDLSPPLGDAAVAGVGDAGDGLVDVGDGVAADHLGGAVARAVVDDDDLVAVVGVVAGEDRGDGVGDHRLAVADGDDDGDEGELGVLGGFGHRREASGGPVRASLRQPGGFQGPLSVSAEVL